MERSCAPRGHRLAAISAVGYFCRTATSFSSTTQGDFCGDFRDVVAEELREDGEAAANDTTDHLSGAGEEGS